MIQPLNQRVYNYNEIHQSVKGTIFFIYTYSYLHRFYITKIFQIKIITYQIGRYSIIQFFELLYKNFLELKSLLLKEEYD